ncbi:hypothetical protein NQ314_009793 [Rhamnusium bicolor]|uniref:Transposase Helix-turn-helix domain-containing protein n=1 Tax=Rhamnusium bicolor TaxID=1586634 RepID=A0AAV8XXJ0_9CUCU|nr:hypothetical protein NQ314_009793 [Rhamnusium bicolor]
MLKWIHFLELLDSSSNSSSSSNLSSSSAEHLLDSLLPEGLQERQNNEGFAENIIPLYTDKEFSEHFKVPRKVLLDLSTEFSRTEYYPKKDTGFKRISAEKCFLIYVWYATHEAASFRDVADRFNIAISTLYNNNRKCWSLFE